LESQARMSRAAGCFGVPGVFLRAALGLVALATLSLVLASVSSAAPWQPDPAPTPQPVTPDPMPDAAPTAPAQPAPVQPVAPTSGERPAPIPNDAPAPATSGPAPSVPAGDGSPARQRAAEARARRRAERRRHHERIEAAAARRKAAAAKEAAAAEPGSFVHFGSLLPSTRSADETHSGILLVAAGALLALVLASGSLLSVATRVMKGQLR
jgi:type IV secretory pathway VirB10-like protein